MTGFNCHKSNPLGGVSVRGCLGEGALCASMTALTDVGQAILKVCGVTSWFVAQDCTGVWESQPSNKHS